MKTKKKIKMANKPSAAFTPKAKGKMKKDQTGDMEPDMSPMPGEKKARKKRLEGMKL